LRLPRRRHRHANLSGDSVGRRLIEHDGELGRRRHQRPQPDQTAPVGGGADEEQVTFRDREQVTSALLGRDPVQKLDCRVVVARSDVASGGPFGVKADTSA